MKSCLPIALWKFVSLDCENLRSPALKPQGHSMQAAYFTLYDTFYVLRLCTSLEKVVLFIWQCRSWRVGGDWFSVLQVHGLLLCLELQFRFRRQSGCNQEEVVINFSCLCALVCVCVCIYSCREQIHSHWQIRGACNDNHSTFLTDTQILPSLFSTFNLLLHAGRVCFCFFSLHLIYFSVICFMIEIDISLYLYIYLSISISIYSGSSFLLHRQTNSETSFS